MYVLNIHITYRYLGILIIYLITSYNITGIVYLQLSVKTGRMTHVHHSTHQSLIPSFSTVHNLITHISLTQETKKARTQKSVNFL